MDSPAPIFIIFIIFAVVMTMVSRLADTDRVKSYIEGRGGRLLEKRWTPFGRGWYGDHNRIYSVRYLDRDGNEHEASCKTNFLSGVYFTEDDIVRYARRPEKDGSLEEENARLKQEIQRLKRGRATSGEDEPGSISR